MWTRWRSCSLIWALTQKFEMESSSFRKRAGSCCRSSEQTYWPARMERLASPAEAAERVRSLPNSSPTAVHRLAGVDGFPWLLSRGSTWRKQMDSTRGCRYSARDHYNRNQESRPNTIRPLPTIKANIKSCILFQDGFSKYYSDDWNPVLEK